MARRMVGHGHADVSPADAVRLFLAERLIALAAGAAFVVAPASIILSGSALPGTYGAAAAIGLVYVAIPFIALGWLSISRAPWMAGIFTLVCWSALAGTLIAVSPLLALTSGLVLFQVAGGSQAAQRMRLLMAPEPETGDESADIAETEGESTLLELTPEGAILQTAGPREKAFRAPRLFIDNVHLADRIAFLEAFADVAKMRRQLAQVSVRVNLAGPKGAQAFAAVRIDLARNDNGVSLKLHEPAEQAHRQEDGQPETDAQKRFLATVSHELRTPLNSIIGFSDILRRDLFGALANERQREYVNLIHSSGTHLLSVVNTILDVSKIDAGTYGIHREPFDLNGTAGECVSMLRSQAEAKGVTFELHTAPEIAEAHADRRAVKQVIINLLSNALKFTERGGEVTLVTERRERGFAIRVSDSGIGMTGEELEMIGTPFMQADNTYTRKREGTGLGLTVVKGLVQLHGGTLDVESEPGKGTQVTVYIPRTAVEPISGGQPDTKTEEFSGVSRAEERGQQKRRIHANAIRLAG
jgi:two-component system, cell cycle sensor histidine kinase DivJ